MRIYINNRDLLTWPLAMAQKMESQGHRVIWIDNNSSYPPLLQFYRRGKPEVILLGQNLGANGPWWGAEVHRNSEPYVVTDPDLDLSKLPDDWPKILAGGLKMWPDDPKCGLGLLPCPMGWSELEIDTTFAMYRPGGEGPSIGGHSAGPPYAVRHLPDFIRQIDAEYDYYLRNARAGPRYSTLKESGVAFPVGKDMILGSIPRRERGKTGEEATPKE